MYLGIHISVALQKGLNYGSMASLSSQHEVSVPTSTLNIHVSSSSHQLVSNVSASFFTSNGQCCETLLVNTVHIGTVLEQQ